MTAEGEKLRPGCRGASSTAQPDSQVAKDWLPRTTLTFLLALLLASRLDLDFLSVEEIGSKPWYRHTSPRCLPPSLLRSLPPCLRA